MQRVEEYPKHLTCPITYDLFKEPVTVFPTGHVYEKSVVDTLISNAKAKNEKPICPIGRKPIEYYTEAWAIKSAVDDYLKKDKTLNEKLSELEKKLENFKDPVTVYPSGHVYERSEIEKLFSISNEKNQIPVCPVTKKPISGYVDAWAIKAAVEEHLKNPHKAPIEKVLSKHNIAANSFKVEQTNIQISEDEKLAREIEREDRYQAIKMEREKQSQSSLYQREKDRLAKILNYDYKISYSDKKLRDQLISDIQDLIWALKFETGPKPKGTIDNFALLFFAFIEQMMLKPLPWQRIKVADGPKNSTAMYNVLKAAKEALQSLDPEILHKVKAENPGFDCVKTVFAGEINLSDGGYAKFAKFMNFTIKDQPGYLIDQILIPVERMLRDLCEKYQPEPDNNIKFTI